MKIIIYTKDAKKLKTEINQKIKDSLETWDIENDIDGNPIYYHSTKSKQWENNFFLKPYINRTNSKLTFKITEKDGIPMEFQSNFGYLMGRFIQTLIVNFSDEFCKLKLN